MKHLKNTEKRNIATADIIMAVIFIAVGLCMLFFGRASSGTGLKVNISVDGNVIKTLSLDKDTVYEAVTDKGRNKIIVDSGRVYVSEADCRDKICVGYKPIYKVGDTIICLPHRLVVEVVQ